jgi:hypothetical protein
MKARTFAGRWLVLLVLAAGCENAPTTGTVSGLVKVDGAVPAEGSSINFVPSDGVSPTAGDLIEDGRYSAEVPVGTAKVEIRVPRPRGGANPNASTEGPGVGPAGGGLIEESLPARYNDQTELTIEVKPGANNKDWELSTK